MMMRSPIDHLVGMVAHDAVVRREVGFAFAAIDDQAFHLQAPAQGEFDRGGEGGAAEAHHAGQGRAPCYLLGGQGEGVGYGVGIDPALGEIGIDGDRGKSQSGRMRRRDLADGGHRA
jgi:hypothetical protein